MWMSQRYSPSPFLFCFSLILFFYSLFLHSSCSMTPFKIISPSNSSISFMMKFGTVIDLCYNGVQWYPCMYGGYDHKTKLLKFFAIGWMGKSSVLWERPLNLLIDPDNINRPNPWLIKNIDYLFAQSESTIQVTPLLSFVRYNCKHCNKEPGKNNPAIVCLACGLVWDSERCIKSEVGVYERYCTNPSTFTCSEDCKDDWSTRYPYETKSTMIVNLSEVLDHSIMEKLEMIKEMVEQDGDMIFDAIDVYKGLDYLLELEKGKREKESIHSVQTMSNNQSKREREEKVNNETVKRNKVELSPILSSTISMAATPPDWNRFIPSVQSSSSSSSSPLSIKERKQQKEKEIEEKIKEIVLLEKEEKEEEERKRKEEQETLRIQKEKEELTIPPLPSRIPLIEQESVKKIMKVYTIELKEDRDYCYSTMVSVGKICTVKLDLIQARYIALRQYFEELKQDITNEMQLFINDKIIAEIELLNNYHQFTISIWHVEARRLLLVNSFHQLLCDISSVRNLWGRQIFTVQEEQQE